MRQKALNLKAEEEWPLPQESLAAVLGADTAAGMQGCCEPLGPSSCPKCLSQLGVPLSPCSGCCRKDLSTGGERVRSETCQACPCPVAGTDHSQSSSKSAPKLQIALLPLLVCIITMKLIFHERVSCFLIRSAPKILTEELLQEDFNAHLCNWALLPWLKLLHSLLV